MESRVYTVDDKKMKFSSKNFKIVLNTFCKDEKLKKQDAEHFIAEKLNISPDTVHKWHYGMSSPGDLELVKALASSVQINDFQTLLENVDGGNNMKQLTDRQVTAVKKIYDICIWFLSEFNKTDGFNGYWHQFKDQGIDDPEASIAELADSMREEVGLVLDQEYFDLRDTDIYNELCEFVGEDLLEIYDGKLSYAYRFEAFVDGNPTTSEDYDKAMIKLNGIIEKYV